MGAKASEGKRVTEAGGEDDLGAAAGPDQTSGADGTMAISDPPGAPLPPGEEAQSSPGWRGVASTEAENWATGPESW